MVVVGVFTIIVNLIVGFLVTRKLNIGSAISLGVFMGLIIGLLVRFKRVSFS